MNKEAITKLVHLIEQEEEKDKMIQASIENEYRERINKLYNHISALERQRAEEIAESTYTKDAYLEAFQKNIQNLISLGREGLHRGHGVVPGFTIEQALKLVRFSIEQDVDTELFLKNAEAASRFLIEFPYYKKYDGTNWVTQPGIQLKLVQIEDLKEKSDFIIEFNIQNSDGFYTIADYSRGLNYAYLPECKNYFIKAKGYLDKMEGLFRLEAQFNSLKGFITFMQDQGIDLYANLTRFAYGDVSFSANDL